MLDACQDTTTGVMSLMPKHKNKRRSSQQFPPLFRAALLHCAKHSSIQVFFRSPSVKSIGMGWCSGKQAETLILAAGLEAACSAHDVGS